MSCRIGAALLAGALVASVAWIAGAATAGAQDLQSWLNGDYATGDWGGARTKLIDAGITPEASYTTDMMAVSNGNAGSGDGWAYAGMLFAGLEFDLEKLAGLPGLSLYASGAWSSGSDLSEQQVGNLFAVQQIYTGDAVRLSELYLQQQALDDMLTFKIGRLSAENDFLASDIYGEYVSAAINGTPINISDSNPGFTGSPSAQWGAVAAYEPVRDLRLALGVYNADDTVNEDKQHGVDFSLDGDAVMVIGEVGYGWNQPPDDDTADADHPGAGDMDTTPRGLPGMAKVGALFESGNREDLGNGRKKEGSPGFYLSGQQMVYRENDDDNQGLTPWAVVSYLPRQSINQIPVFFAGGFIYEGLIPSRDQDTSAIGFFYGKLSSDLEPGGSEKVLELAYSVQLTPWCYVRPDVQLVFDPAGDSNADTALVGGGEIGILF